MATSSAATWATTNAVFAQTPATFRFTDKNNVISLEGGDRTPAFDKRSFDGDVSVSKKGKLLSIDGRLAGTNINIRLRITISGSNLDITSHDATVRTVSAAGWISGSASVPIEIKLDNTSTPDLVIAVPKRRFSAALRAPFQVSAALPLSYSGEECGDGTARGITVQSFTNQDVVDEDLAQIAPNTRPLIRVQLDRVSLAAGQTHWELGSVDERLLFMQLAADQGTLALDTILGSSRKIVLRRKGASSGKEGARIRYGVERYGRDIHIGYAELLQVLHGRSSERGLRIGRRAETAYIEADRYAAAIRIDENHFFHPFDSRASIDIPIKLLVLHARAEGDARCDIDFRTIKHDGAGPLPDEPGLNRSAIVWDTQGTQGIDAVLTLGAVAAKPGAVPHQLFLGRRDGAHVLLHRPGATTISADSPMVRIRRAANALDLGLLFHNYRLEIGDTSQLVPLDGARRGVRFHPQHLEEESFNDPEPAPGALTLAYRAAKRRMLGAPKPDPSIPRDIGNTDDGVYFPGWASTELARSQVSGASRIVFEPETTPEPIPLSVDALTKWGGLKLSSSDRAAGDIPVEEQLAVIGIDEKTTRAQARQQVSKSLTPPTSDETSLELVTGLFFAPQNTARFRTSNATLAPTALWSAQLDLSLPVSRPPKSAKGEPQQQSAANATVRAVWATGLDDCRLFQKTCLHQTTDPFFTSTKRAYRIEVAIQSSVFGIAALRAVTVQGVDVPNSRVHRVAPSWEFVSKIALPPPGTPPETPNPPKVVQEGVMSPAPFKEFNARLTSYGVDLDCEWRAKPIKPFIDKTHPEHEPFFETAFGVEGLIQRLRLGSLSYGLVSLEGYLFPYGFAVSLLIATPREPKVLGNFGAMMPLITRYYLLPKPVKKTFPGIYQPFEGREIPLRSARLLGELSPELDPRRMATPVDMKLPKISSEEDELSRVFWPMKKKGGALNFDFEPDDLGTRRTLPMMYVPNARAAHPESVKEIIRYYNGLAEEQRREEHHGAMTIFAAPKLDDIGSTSFATDHAILAARPRSIPVAAPDAQQPVDDLAAYTMDAFANGADEPPFYAVMAEASVIVPPLDRIMASPQGLRRVGYNSNYVRVGFDAAGNKSELYLNFLEPGVMRLGGDGRMTGGVAQTPTPIAGISRQSAIVGAKATGLKARALAMGADGLPPVGSDDGAPWDYASLAKGEFDPRDYFSGSSLLGAVDLADIIERVGAEAQPKLKEIYSYALGESGALSTLKDLCGLVSRLIDESISEANAALKKLFENDPDAPSGDVSVERYYPELVGQLRAFQALLNGAPGADVPEKLPAWATKVAAQWRGVKIAIDAVLANPSPEPLRAGMAKLRTFIDTLQDSFGTGLRQAIKDALQKAIDGALKDLIKVVVGACFDASNTLRAPWIFEALLGRRPDPTITPDQLRTEFQTLFAQPQAVPVNVRKAVLGANFIVPLLDALAQVRNLANQVGKLDESAIKAAAQAGVASLRQMAEAALGIDAMVAAARQYATTLCTAAGNSLRLEALCKLALKVVPSRITLDDTITDIRSAWPALDLNALPDTDAVLTARRASRALLSSIASLQTALHQLDEVRADIAKLDLDQLCAAVPQQLPPLIARLIAARNDVFTAFEVAADAARQLVDAYAALPASEIGSAVSLFKTVRSHLLKLCASLTTSSITDVAQQVAYLETLPVVGPRVEITRKAVVSTAAQLAVDVGAATSATIDQLWEILQASRALGAVEAKFFGLATDFASLTSDLVNAAQTVRQELVLDIAAPLVTLHQTVLDLAKDTITEFDNAPDLVKLFTQKLYQRLVKVRGEIERDAKALRDLSNAGGSTELTDLIARWRNNESGLVEAAGLIVDFFNSLMTGQVGAIFNLEGVRKAAEDAVRQLVPTKVNLSYDWKGGLKKFAIFEPEGAKEITLSTAIAIDLLDPSNRKVDVSGTVSEFKLRLFESPDLVTIGFAASTFTFDGGVPKFDTRIASIEQGTALQFLNGISSLIGNQGNGVYVSPSLEGIKIGYRYSKDLIELGGLQLLNFAFDASLALRFNGEDAVADISLSSREKPCGLIIAPAYYGAAFFSLKATTKEIVSFEIQFEFGAARALQFGPLSGSAAVSAGIYLRKSGKNSVFEGFVHAVGEGHIACFGVSVNFEVKVRQENGGNVVGNASYRFTFRVGMFKVGYGVTASYAFAGGAKFRPARQLSIASPRLAISGYAPLPDKLTDWLGYRQNFIPEWPTA